MIVTVLDMKRVKKPCTPTPVVQAGDVTLKAGRDYTVEYFNNNPASKDYTEGPSWVEITGKGNYTGLKTAYFYLYTKSAKSFVVKVETAKFVYDGTEQMPKVTVYASKKDQKNQVMLGARYYKVSYENNVNAGTGKILITGRNGYGETKIIKFKIQPKSLTDEDILKNLTSTVYTYTGKAILPDTDCSFNGETLSAGKDYTVIYADNVELTEHASVTVTGKGNYEGVVSAEFRIYRNSLSTAVMDPYTAIYDGTEQYPDTHIYANKKAQKAGEYLVENKDYVVVSCVNNVRVGTAKLTIAGIGTEYGGTKTFTFKIKKR